MAVRGRVPNGGAGCCPPHARPREDHRLVRGRSVLKRRVHLLPATRLLQPTFKDARRMEFP